MLGLSTLPRLFHLLFLLPNSPRLQAVSSSAEIHPDSVTTLGLQQGKISRERSGLCCSQQAWGGTALPALKGRTKNVGTVITKSSAMLPPALEQLLRSPRDLAEGSAVARSCRAARRAGSRTGSPRKRKGNSQLPSQHWPRRVTSRGAIRDLVPHGEPGSLCKRCAAPGQQSRGVSHLHPGERELRV